MSPVYSPIRYYSLLKACMIFFIIQAVIVFLFFSSIWYSELVFRFLTLVLNIVLSVVLGWRLYKHRYHLVFSYDEEGFALKEGNREEASHKWSEFSKVSLIRTEQGDFSLRLQNKDSYDLPASKLKLSPFEFRETATKLIEASQKKRSP